MTTQPHACSQREHLTPHEHSLSNERNTRRVVLLTLVMMVAEIACGTMYHSMALLADGWHMATHAGALGIALFAYRYARKQAGNPHFTFGTGKVNALGGFASAVVLALVALLVAAESAARLYSPQPINFDDAIFVAVLGLLVNLVSAWMLRGEPHHHHHHHDDDHDHEHSHTHDHDHNLKAAYLHVIADAVTSLTAIGALLLGKYLGWVWMDPLMGIAGSVLIAVWARGLIRQTSHVLLDRTSGIEPAVRNLLERSGQTRVTDLHIWQIGPENYSAVISLCTQSPMPPEHYKAQLSTLSKLTHITVEVNRSAA